MAADTDARRITLNYSGGSLEMAVGNAKDLFGEDYTLLASTAVPTEVSVKSHQRVRVIGEAPTTVSAHSYTYDKWPTSQAGLAQGGTIILMDWEGSEGVWQCRVSGSMADLSTFLSEAAPKPVTFRTERGTKYGPFFAGTEG